MPELKNETPSKQELWGYFLEHCPWMAAPDEPGYLDSTDIVEAQTRYGCLDFRVKVGQVIWEALNELNALDRADSFWANTNHRPTVYKLLDFAAMRLDTNPENQRALWTLAVLDTFYGSNDFGSEYWRQLWELGDLDIHWPIRAALWNEVMLGFGGRKIADLIIRMAAQQVAWSIFEEMTLANASIIRDWAQEVLTFLSEDRAEHALGADSP